MLKIKIINNKTELFFELVIEIYKFAECIHRHIFLQSRLDPKQIKNALIEHELVNCSKVIYDVYENFHKTIVST